MQVNRGFSFLFALSALFGFHQASAGVIISDVIRLGNDPGEFFEGLDPAGETTFTNTVSFSDEDITVDLTLTAEGFDSGGAPAPIMASPFSSGVGVADNDLNAGESIRFTYDSISATAGPMAPPIDPTSIGLFLSSILFAANFDAGEDTFTYTGVGEASLIGDDTRNPTFNPVALVTETDSFTITADSSNANGFSLFFISHRAEFELSQNEIPEPAAIGLIAIAMATASVRRRRR